MEQGRNPPASAPPPEEDLALETVCGRAFIFSHLPFSWNLGIQFPKKPTQIETCTVAAVAVESACPTQALPLATGFLGGRHLSAWVLCPVVIISCYGGKMQLDGRFWIDTDTTLGSTHLPQGEHSLGTAHVA